jgi:glycosyltransferase involved in cell wall biosynthesis
MAHLGTPISVVIPAYNEEKGIGPVLDTLKSVLDNAHFNHEIIVVDDGSNDGTETAANMPGVRLIRHRKNRGYGASLKTGIRAARNDTIVITDADGTYPSEAIPELVKRFETSDMIVGARVGQNVNIPLIRRPAKWVLRKLAEYVSREPISDLNSGLRVFSRQAALQYFNILPDKFSFTTTITVAMISDGYRVRYFPIDYFKRSGKSKIVPWDFVEFVSLVLRVCILFSPLRVFVPVALFAFLVGTIKFLFDVIVALKISGGFNFAFMTQPLISDSTIIFWLAALQIILIGMVADGVIRKLSTSIPICSDVPPTNPVPDISQEQKAD